MPAITLSSFAGMKQGRGIELGFSFDREEPGGRDEVTLRLAAAPEKSTPGWTTELSSPQLSRVRDLGDAEALAASVARLTKYPIDDDAQAQDLVNVATILRKYMGLEGSTKFLSESIAEASFRERAGDFLIYNANQLALRGLMNISRKEPLGIHGENLDVAIASLGDEGLKELLERSALIRWVERIFTDPEDKLKFEGYKLGRSTSTLYFRDRFMRKRANIFSAENANEGILHALFYLTLFISDRTPKTFGIDNIETALNPRLCRNLIKQLAELSKSHDKQALITTHNPAALDGLDLHDDEQRLFVVSRNDAGHTVAQRIKLKPPAKDKEPRLMLSEMWMRGHLGGIPLEF